MLDIIPHIQYLVATTDCVVLPGWGAFISSHINAYVSDGLMYPPTRAISFNPSLTHDDGSLVASVVRKTGVGYPTAKASVSAAIGQMRKLYNTEGVITIPRVGTLRRDSNDKTIFTPSAESVAAGAYLALPTLEVSPAVPVAVEKGAKVARISGIRAFGRVAAGIAILLGLSITLTTPVVVDRSVNQYAGMPAPEITPAKILSLPVPTESQVLYIATPDPAEATETVAAFYLIVSSHSNHAEASRFVAAHPDDNLTIFESDGRFRVVAATGASFSETAKLKSDADFDRKYPDAWVLKK